ncbi:MAG: site-specific DNA-methyltransferase, partial [Deltaproteobacteria bacterium]|nr:site-specific DNA-methyltransferase [Deltaproteobacteria bacterium]
EVLSIAGAISKGYKIDDENRIFKTAPRGDYTDISIERLDKEGRIYRTKTGTVRIKYFLEKAGRNNFIEKKLIGDVWSDLPDMMHSPPKERTGYATQKPAALMERIIKCSTDEGEVVLDIFSGSGTTALVAETMGRRFIATDKNPAAIRLARARLIERGARPFTIESTNEERPASELTIKKPIVKELDDGRFSIEVELKGYTPADELQGKIKESVGRLSSSLDIIDYWTIDWDYDGENFNALWSSSRGYGKDNTPLNLIARVTVEERPRRIALRATDILTGQTGVIAVDI